MTTTSGTTLNRLSLFNSFRLESRSPALEGGTLTAVFGSGNVDLRGRDPWRTARNSRLSPFSSDLNIHIPADWQVETDAVELFGGIKFRGASPTAEAAARGRCCGLAASPCSGISSRATPEDAPIGAESP